MGGRANCRLFHNRGEIIYGRNMPPSRTGETAHGGACRCGRRGLPGLRWLAMTRARALLLLIIGTLPVALAHAQTSANDAARRQAADLALFERKAALAKELGATHMLVTEGLPPATWEMEPNDPYPMWFEHHAGLLAIFPPQSSGPTSTQNTPPTSSASCSSDATCSRRTD